jgi:hypothetical protein
MILPRNSPNHKWRSFDKALKWTHKQNIKNKNDWKKLCNSKNFPKDVPKTPMHVYANELKGKGLGYWYGTNKKSNHDIVWRPFKEAREFVRKLEFQNTEEHNKWAKTEQKPQNIPTAPKRIYAEFSTMEDWLGNKERKKNVYLNYFEAKKWAKSKKILTGAMWQNLSSQNKIPKNIPKAPGQFYDEWEGWPKFLETIIDYMSYDEAKSFVKSKKILGESSYRKYIKKNKLPKNFPRSVESHYKKQGTWISWGDFTGTGNVAPKDRKYRSYDEAKKYVHTLKLKGKPHWEKLRKLKKIPVDMPGTPNTIYKKQGTWISWGDFLGTNNMSSIIRSKSFISPKVAKLMYKKLFKEYNINNGNDWKKFAKTHGKLLEKLNLPTEPFVIYHKKNVQRWKK